MADIRHTFRDLGDGVSADVTEIRYELNSGDRGPQGKQGASAYEVAVANGFVGTEAEWLASLVADGGGAVDSVNDQTGVVVLDAADVGAETPAGAQAKVDTHAADTTSVHGIADTSLLATTSDVSTASTADRARGNHTGTQTSATISDFTEAVQDAVAALLSSGTNVTLTYDDAANSLTVTAATGGDAEVMRDTIGAALVGVGNVSVTVNDAADTITVSTTATVNSTDAALRDRATHTGTQAASTITGLGDAAAKNTGTTAGTVAAGDDSRITGAAQKSANLSDLASATTARTNLGLGTAATANTGTGATNVILGNDTRLTDSRTPTAHNHAASDVTSGTLAVARLGTGTPAAGKYVDGGTGAWTTLPAGGGAGTYPITRTAVATATNPGTANLTFVAIDTTCDVTIPAAAGDKLLIAPAGRWIQSTVIGWMDAAIVVSGSIVRYCSGGGTNGPGWQNWFHDDVATRQIIGGPMAYTVVSGDVSGGQVTVRLVFRANTTGTVTITNDTASKLWNQVTNLGPN